MNKRKGFLEEIRHSLLLESLQEYYKVKDLEYETNYLEIFTEIFINNDRPSYEEIEYKFFITTSTLRRFILKTNLLAEKISKHFGYGGIDRVGVE